MFRDLPIRQKLMAVIMLTTGIALLLSGAGIIFADSLLFRSYLERDLTTLSRIVADNSTAALEFDDPGSAHETLAALHARPYVDAACIYRPDKSVLATYYRPGAATACPASAAGYEIRSESSNITVSQPIMLQGRRIGALVLRYGLGEIAGRVRVYGTTVLGVLLVSSFAAFLLSSRLRQIIATPISQLAHTAASVSATKDYSIRAERHSKDELGLLVEAFNGMLSGIQSRDIDLTKALGEREDALAEARSARDFLRTTLASIADAVIATDLSGRIVFANPVALALLGRPEAGTTGCLVEDCFPIVQRATAGTDDHAFLIAADGTEVPIDHSAAPIFTESGEMAGAVLIFRDITERVKAEEERERLNQEMLATEERLRQSAKLESLGVLAGGIAHDFNNLLVGMLGNASLAEEMLPPDSPIVPIIQNVVGASEKAAQLTHQMLAYSGKGRFIIERVDLSKAVEDILPLISRPIPKSVSIQLDLESGLPPIEADKSQLQQILMNLVINAAESCGTHPGVVSIKTCRAELNAQAVPPSFGLAPIQPGTFIALEIKDTGSGMSEEVKAKIFDPFFTTKFTGRGLGLSAVLGIIRSHKGAVHVESAAGAGTTFRVYFPAAEGKLENEPVKAPEARTRAGTGTVLVVDDEEIVRTLAKAALENQGYRVLLAEDGQIGVRTFMEHSDSICMVVLDLTMPVMDGEAALGHMKKIDPAVKVVLSSGFDRLELSERFKGKGVAGFLQKPYTSIKLLQIVDSAIGNSGPRRRNAYASSGERPR